MFLRGFRPRARCTIYTPMLPLSRGESFLENRVFSDPDVVEWDSLDQTTRRDFVKHSDRGVFDPPSLGKIAYDDTVRFVLGRVNDVHRGAGGTGCGSGTRRRRGRPAASASSSSTAPASTCWRRCASCSPRRCARRSRPRSASRCGRAERGAEAPIGRHMELRGMRPLLQVPGMAGLSQGPGFANLGALGLLANRVLQPALPTSAPIAGNLSTSNRKSLLFD